MRLCRGIAVAVLFILAANLAAAGAPPTADAPRQTDARYEVKVTPEMIRHTRIEHTLFFAGETYSIIVLLLILTTGLSARLRDIASRMVRARWLRNAIYIVLLILVTNVAAFPLRYYGGFVVPHQFDLATQSFPAWLADFAKGLGVDLVITTVVGVLALWCIGHFRRWWLPLWIGSIPLILIGVVVWPLFVDPLFNKFVPLRDASLRQALLDQASRAGIEGGRVYEVDKSKQTKEMNAYVTGLGPSKRIVMWDTLLAKMSRDEILAVMGHEMGHYVLHHIWKGLAFSVLLSLIGFLIAQRFYERGLDRWGWRWRISADRADPAAVPWLLIISAIITFFLLPAISGFSRWEEHQADQFGLELTHLNDAMATSFVKFAEDSKVDPNPSPVIEFWLYSHPSLAKRIDFVRHYKPWEEGKPNELWKR